jgi:hypothetical protein
MEVHMTAANRMDGTFAVPDADLMLEAGRATIGAWTAPNFDALRAGYATLVSLRVLPRSMLASRDVERAVDTLERCTLGPFARRV